jgi:hypothetical protein
VRVFFPWRLRTWAAAVIVSRRCRVIAIEALAKSGLPIASSPTPGTSG